MEATPSSASSSRYGHIPDGDGGYPLAAWVWGHRMRMGQHWVEYFLEFLNVLAGFDYRLGQGLSPREVGEEPSGYRIYRRLGLRRFVFYDEHEKSLHPDDTEARDQLLKQLQDSLGNGAPSAPEDLEHVRTLLRSFSAVEESRSWFAKSLFPAHDALLFWEATRKGVKHRRDDVEAEGGKPPRELDEAIRFDQRNFFARGGELYYLVLSAGTEGAPQLRTDIEDGFKSLLFERNKAIGELATLVNDAWTKLLGQDDDSSKRRDLGWIPRQGAPLFRQVALDVRAILQAQLEPFETLDLLVHLVCFHLALYIYSAAGETEKLGPFLVDSVGKRGTPLRQASATLLKQQEAAILGKAIDYARAAVRSFAEDLDTDGLAFSEDLHSRAFEHFGVRSLRKATREPFEQKTLHALQVQLERGDLTRAQFVEQYGEALIQELLLTDFRKNFLGVHLKLGKAVGFVAPHKGPSARFVIGDTLLQTLAITACQKDTEPYDAREVTFDDFLRTLYERYGVVVGEREARASGLFREERINAEAYSRNRDALLDRLIKAGYAREFSDATAVVAATHATTA